MDDAASKLLGPILDAIQGEGIDAKYLAKKLKEELEATEVKVFNDREGGIIYSDPLIAWKVRQSARQDAHKLLDHYPSEKHDHTVNLGNPMSIAVQVYQQHKTTPPRCLLHTGALSVRVGGNSGDPGPDHQGDE